MKPNFFKEKIIRILAAHTKKYWNVSGSKRWTTVVKRALTKLGHKEKYKVCASLRSKKFKPDYGEWLYDLCWIKEKPNWKDGLSLVLAAEIEWSLNMDDILSDFQKLTVADASFRLFVGWYRDKTIDGEKRLNKVVNACKKSCPKAKNFRYLFVVIPHYSPKNLKYFVWRK